MPYSSELNLVRAAFKKMHIQTLLPYSEIPQNGQPADMGIRRLLDIDEDPLEVIFEQVEKAELNTAYTIVDRFMCTYMYMRLPDRENEALLIGPYLSKSITRQEIAEMCHGLNIPVGYLSDIEKYYSSIPYLAEDSHMFILLDTFFDKIWGEDNYNVINSRLQPMKDLSSILSRGRKTVGREAWNMKLIETRYSYENELIKAVSKGQSHKIKLLSNFTQLNFEKRTPDALRNMKNYSIIMNTLFRKAAENGGVHPVHLDSISSEFAFKIEQCPSVSAAHELMADIFITYCRLVKKHSIRQYSPPVQKALTYIESDLSQDLSLSTLAQMQSISPSYLSNIFKKETDHTVTEFVNSKRMEYAAHLLGTTRQQIQTIAQLCGILDVQYFSKLFKKYKGETPKEYRKNRQSNIIEH